MKKSIIASLAALACAAVLGTFALTGAGKFGNVQVDAGTTEYSVTFDGDTPYQVVSGNYVFYVETESGNKVGLVATQYVNYNLITFHGMDFESLFFYDEGGSLTKAGAYGFSSITYFDVDYSGGLLWFLDNNGIQTIDGEKQKTERNPPINPYIEPEDFEGPKATISSITIWYSC